jgi:hypothetical protein
MVDAIRITLDAQEGMVIMSILGEFSPDHSTTTPLYRGLSKYFRSYPFIDPLDDNGFINLGPGYEELMKLDGTYT